MIIYNKLDNYFVVSADRQTFLGFEMTTNLRDTSPLKLDGLAPTKDRLMLLFEAQENKKDNNVASQERQRSTTQVQ